MTDLSFLSLDAAAEGIRSRSHSATELLEACVQRIEKFGRDHNVFTNLLIDEARTRAEKLDDEAKRGTFRGPLHGIPLAVKDLIDVAGHTNTGGTACRRGGPPATANAPVTQALLDAGAMIVGLTNLHEWAYGGTSNNPSFGPVRNLWDPARMPGGSSGGSAVAVSGGMAFAALGTDTGGSVRIPASVTGTSSLKVTVGKLSTTGVLPLSWTLDSVGPMTRRAEDLFRPYAALLGRGDRSRRQGPRTPDLRDLVLGIDRAYYLEQGRMEPGIYSGFTQALEQLEAAGITIKDVSIPKLTHASAAQYLLVLAEASAVHSGTRRVDRPQYGEDVQGYLALGDTLLAQDYIAALRFRTELFEEYRAAFEEVDFLVSPTTPHAASLIEQGEFTWPDGSIESLLDACWRFTFPSNLVGIPSTSQPCALTEDELPVGFQLIGRPHSEWALLETASRLEREFAWDFRPPLTQG